MYIYVYIYIYIYNPLDGDSGHFPALHTSRVFLERRERREQFFQEERQVCCSRRWRNVSVFE